MYLMFHELIFYFVICILQSPKSLLYAAFGVFHFSLQCIVTQNYAHSGGSGGIKNNVTNTWRRVKQNFKLFSYEY